MKTEVFAIISLVKALIIKVGLGFTFWSFTKGLLKRDANGRTKALKYFAWTFVIVVIGSLIEFLAAFLSAS